MRLFSLIIILFLLIFPAESQIIQYYDVKDLFDGTDWEDKVTETQTMPTYWGGKKIWTRYVHSDSASIDTIVSRPIENRGWGNKFISLTVITDSALTAEIDTISYKLEMGVFRGYGTVSGTTAGSADTDGILWKHLYTGTGEVSTEVSISDSTWWQDYATPWYWLRICEADTQYNKYYISDFSLKER